ncbi:MAG TPA: DUF308 domain-containing protein [Gemmatimonadaceae bacterium]|nr:DUF308 domain-containing protein [Gemmatimonadaceae bacterium]
MDRPVLSRFGWFLILRGVIGALFGLLALSRPTVTLGVVIAFFGAFVLADGIAGIVFALLAPRERMQIWPFLLNGIVGILVGIAALVAPLATTKPLQTLFAVWAFVTGVFEMVQAIRLRRVISGEWMLYLTGLMSILAGVVLLVWPRAGVGAIITFFGYFALLFGLLQIALGIRVRAWGAQPTP